MHSNLASVLQQDSAGWANKTKETVECILNFVAIDFRCEKEAACVQSSKCEREDSRHPHVAVHIHTYICIYVYVRPPPHFSMHTYVYGVNIKNANVHGHNTHPFGPLPSRVHCGCNRPRPDPRPEPHPWMHPKGFGRQALLLMPGICSPEETPFPGPLGKTSNEVGSRLSAASNLGGWRMWRLRSGGWMVHGACWMDLVRCVVSNSTAHRRLPIWDARPLDMHAAWTHPACTVRCNIRNKRIVHF